MFLYSLTIQPPSHVVQAVLGQFGNTKEQLIVTAAGSQLTLLRPDPTVGKVHTVLTHDVFGIVRSLAACRVTGSSKDFLVVASDSGRATIVEYLTEQNRFCRVHMETYGKSGIRRVIPGEYLVCDPRGRAFLVASVEKNKLVYVLNRIAGASGEGNLAAELTISSPLEAHKPGVMVIAMVALDVAYLNPVFAALEVDCSEVDQDATGQAMEEVQTQLVYYELDLGLNHVVRKWSETVDPTASMLFQVPGGSDGPSGVLVCGQESITFMHSNQNPLRVPIPRRRGATEDPNRKRFIVAGIMHKLKGSSGAFFFLLQTEDGDLFKVSMEIINDHRGKPTADVKQIIIKYFDTLPVASSFCILKSGYLYVASQYGDAGFYQFEKLADDDDELEFSSDNFPADPQASYEPVYFHPRPAVNLTMVQRIPSMNPLIDCKVANLTGEDAPQVYTHGLDVTHIVGSELPGAPVAVWTLKLNRNDNIGETVEEVSDSGFLTDVPTLAAQLLGDGGLLQVHPKGIRVIRNGKPPDDWEAPLHRSIVAAATNAQQVAIALSSGEIIYFEADDEGNLNEFEDKKAMSGTVTCLSLGEVPEGRLRSSFLAVGCDDCTVRILSLDHGATLDNKSVQALTAAPTSLAIIAMDDSSSGGSTLYLHIGLHSGVYLRTVVDEVSGELTDTRQRFLGPKQVKLFQLTVEGKTCVLALSSRPWLGYPDPITKTYMMAPLNYPELQWGWNFTSEQCEEGLVTIHGQDLSIISIDRLGVTLTQRSVPLSYTPRKLIKHPDQPVFYSIESDNNTLPPKLRSQLLADPAAVNGDAKVLPPEIFGHPRGNRHWASCISVIDPVSEEPEVLQTLHLDENESAVSATIVPFSSQDGESFLVVGTGKDVVVNPRSFSEAFIHVYRLNEGGRQIEFVHKTAVEEPPLALIPFQGKVLAGIGKAEAGPQQIVSLNTQGNRIVVGDVQYGITYVVYKPATNKLIPFVDDTAARWTTCTAMVDYESVAGGDKFGNVWVVRCPPKASEEADEEDSGIHLTNARSYLHGTSRRLDLMCHFYTQDIPTSVTKTSLIVGGQDVLLWSGLMGTIGVLIPLVSREDADFFQSLEQHLRSDDAPLVGRDHLMYRSYYAPVKGVIDGDLCERYNLLSNDKKMTIAGELDRSVREIERKISDIRTRSAF
ncbi:mono-functional DNA-alkylating methyl methanesulfonate n-term domain-containing protein [Hirsutella rhossiliensis]|uniref:Mono-functional DNA-alkylating methyl methanesulfonate n-term domain-containing protein n=1 Tax=Hirsutella rhossiliensis TaxID=111463 RepID=A0A9P8SME5_9HYPO|nr:mono-functional DNA-alkylating methyl methanesulfonate n-term domain-containing protein [Hirsutella rhossiliensis]KAH0966770.1 mono-functional DNA-alkylating methyl methanesulfonate n-term domain-containing protein [Hirsutella rhossiliensis]